MHWPVCMRPPKGSRVTTSVPLPAESKSPVPDKACIGCQGDAGNPTHLPACLLAYLLTELEARVKEGIKRHIAHTWGTPRGTEPPPPQCDC